MTKDEIGFAVRIPEALVREVDSFIADNSGECMVERKVITRDEKGEKLGFDPGTGSEICWLALKFIGTAALDVALGVLASFIYDRLRRKGPPTIEVRLPTLETINIPTDQPIDKEKLREILESSISGED